MKKNIKTEEKGWIVFSDKGEYASSFMSTDEGKHYRIQYITTCINEAAVISQKAAAVEAAAACDTMLKNRKWLVGRIERNTKIYAVTDAA